MFAIRSSINRPTGTSVLSTIVVTKNVYREYLLSKVLPAIKSMWISEHGQDNGTIFIQQDNARPHVSVDDAMFAARAKELDLNVRLINQPAQSPDLNVLDLGFFNSIQLQQQMECRTMEDLICAVQEAFTQLPAMTLEKTFRTWRRVMLACVECHGDNTFKIPRSKKDEDYTAALELMNLRLEEEDRLNEVYDLMNAFSL
ncbi:hypothetical protein Ae201684_002635 [Aphanomyces euteiches]|uniref:Tc1-like transposase DDE domain-containing protein n=1 Tax=Aphanomyces euteiches TaxID=100861 RepID=A0A6G0XPX4_9STRA|nr:hypothetical protein Ae201684_002635 [Aphanomyces euteiches]